MSSQFDKEKESLKFELDNNPKLRFPRKGYVIQRLGYIYGYEDGDKNREVSLRNQMVMVREAIESQKKNAEFFMKIEKKTKEPNKMRLQGYESTIITCELLLQSLGLDGEHK